MPESLLTIFNLLFLALLFLFLFRVVHVVVMELRHPAVPIVPPVRPPVAPPAPAAPAKRDGKGPTLRIVEPTTRAGEFFPSDDDVTVGRAGGCGVVLTDDTFVSQVHARVFRRGRQIYVEDLDSRNGTFVNGERITTPTQLKKGARVQFGSTIAEVVR